MKTFTLFGMLVLGWVATAGSAGATPSRAAQQAASWLAGTELDRLEIKVSQTKENVYRMEVRRGNSWREFDVSRGHDGGEVHVKNVNDEADWAQVWLRQSGAVRWVFNGWGLPTSREKLTGPELALARVLRQLAAPGTDGARVVLSRASADGGAASPISVALFKGDRVTRWQFPAAGSRPLGRATRTRHAESSARPRK
ncbi:MAG: hypothetical protein IT371_29235 [Deltaproteobacteria bacterium]|nr:hypothetical protein [Deltaproteobacteria bacterium]